MSKRSKSQPVVLRKADGTVYSQHRYPKEREDDKDMPTLGSLQLLEKITKRQQARRKRLRGES